MEDTNAKGEAWHTGYEAHEQGEPRSNAEAHYGKGTWEYEQWLDGWERAFYELHNVGAE